MAIVPQPVPTGYTSGNCTQYQPVSEAFTFNVSCLPSRSQNPKRQLMWLNRYGTWDYYALLFERYEGLNITRQSYKSLNIDWGSDNPVKTQYSRGKTDAVVNMEQTVVTNSGFVNQPTFQWLQDLYTSQLVYEIQPDGGVWPVNILNTEFEIKIEGNRSLFNLEVQYQYSNNIQLLSQ
jgi:hypothetical protein